MTEQNTGGPAFFTLRYERGEVDYISYVPEPGTILYTRPMDEVTSGNGG